MDKFELPEYYNTKKPKEEEKAYEDISKTGYVDWYIGRHGGNGIIDIEEIK